MLTHADDNLDADAEISPMTLGNMRANGTGKFVISRLMVRHRLEIVPPLKNRKTARLSPS